MRCSHRACACAVKRGWVHTGPPPLIARGGRIAAIALVACLATACSSSRAATSPTATVLKVPPPFEVGQQVGLGSATMMVESFEHTGDSLTATVKVANDAPRALSIVAGRVFSIFYGADLRRPRRTTGLDRPIPPNAVGTASLEFAVPARYRYPLLWVGATPAGNQPETVVLRGAHS